MNREIILSPSLLSADFGKIKEELDSIKLAGCKYVHLDVMDGNYVPNISFGIPVIKSIRKYSNLIFDVHLMVDEPDRFIDKFVEAGSDIITVHVEACKHLDRTVSHIKSLGVKAGVSLNPTSPLCLIEHIIERVDQILIMSVNPGFGNQSFIDYTHEKIKRIRDVIDTKKLNIDIEVDGGIKTENIKSVIDSGANILVAGSAVFGNNTYENAKKFNEILMTYEK